MSHTTIPTNGRGEQNTDSHPAHMTPPSTDADSGNWDASGSIRGYELDANGLNLGCIDAIIERDTELAGRRCIILRCTRYSASGTTTRGAAQYGERETWYVGKVHAPDIDSLPAGVYGTYIRECYPDNGWFAWTERHWENNPTHTETRQEMALRKTRRLAQGARDRLEGEI